MWCNNPTRPRFHGVFAPSRPPVQNGNGSCLPTSWAIKASSVSGLLVPRARNCRSESPGSWTTTSTNNLSTGRSSHSPCSPRRHLNSSSTTPPLARWAGMVRGRLPVSPRKPRSLTPRGSPAWFSSVYKTRASKLPVDTDSISPVARGSNSMDRTNRSSRCFTCSNSPNGMTSHETGKDWSKGGGAWKRGRGRWPKYILKPETGTRWNADPARSASKCLSPGSAERVGTSPRQPL